MRKRYGVVLLMGLLLVLAACGGSAQPETSGSGTSQPPAQEEATPAPTEEVMAEPTEEVMEEPMGLELPAETGALSMVDNLLALDAGSCEYGGKFESIVATDENTVVFTMCSPDPAFLAKIAFEGFGIHPAEYLISTGGTGDILEKPIGTGPYKLEAWNRGDSLVLTRNEDYWGDAPLDETMVIRWNSEGAARLLELQSGQVDQINFVSPDDFETVEGDPNLALLPSANPNVLYLAMTNTFEPFDNVEVRQAVARGIDRARLVDNFYPVGSEVASHFTPCTIPNGCTGDAWYDFDLEEANAMLDDAGFPKDANGIRFKTAIYYRDVFRVYLPEPGLVAVELQDQLRENLGIEADVVVMESGEFIAESTAGNLDGFYLLGWGADYPHVTNFLDFHFSEANPQFGDTHSEIYGPLDEASKIADLDEAEPLYTEANNMIRELVPMVPLAHGAAADAARVDAEGAHVRPFGAYLGRIVDTPDDVLVIMQAAEPISLYCPDETDGETFRACAQINDSLMGYALDSGDIVPALATSCEATNDATVWTCKLREGVTFHDGSTFDANDVVMSFAVGLDAASPLHTGNTGAWEYYSYLWGLINADE